MLLFYGIAIHEYLSVRVTERVVVRQQGEVLHLVSIIGLQHIKGTATLTLFLGIGELRGILVFLGNLSLLIFLAHC
jgi:hypothetical protein